MQLLTIYSTSLLAHPTLSSPFLHTPVMHSLPPISTSHFPSKVPRKWVLARQTKNSNPDATMLSFPTNKPSLQHSRYQPPPLPSYKSLLHYAYPIDAETNIQYTVAFWDGSCPDRRRSSSTCLQGTCNRTCPITRPHLCCTISLRSTPNASLLL